MAELDGYRSIVVASQSISWLVGKALRLRFAVETHRPTGLLERGKEQCLILAPTHVLLSVVFWGWLRGIAGAFLSVPLTAAIVVTCGQFEDTRWFAALASDATARRYT